MDIMTRLLLLNESLAENGLITTNEKESMKELIWNYEGVLKKTDRKILMEADITLQTAGRRV